MRHDRDRQRRWQAASELHARRSAVQDHHLPRKNHGCRACRDGRLGNGAVVASTRVGRGGGLEGEGEDIEVIEVAFDDALAMIERGEIVDAKTIMLLQYAALHIFASSRSFDRLDAHLP